VILICYGTLNVSVFCYCKHELILAGTVVTDKSGTYTSK